MDPKKNYIETTRELFKDLLAGSAYDPNLLKIWHGGSAHHVYYDTKFVGVYHPEKGLLVCRGGVPYDCKTGHVIRKDVAQKPISLPELMQRLTI